ncbi:MAG: GH3 auxin-responsive promoter family protein [Paludibacteraceae bacterium]|nr:GH3 auxin-responsive promoter family protein [Paludibacteraceae bacterium]
MKTSDNSFIPNILLRIAGGPQYQYLKRACRNPRKAQELTLRSILSYAKDSVYGREHGFARVLEAEDAEELFLRYQEAVPAQDYEQLRPYVERHKKGEADVLFPGKPRMYATTSGTTKEPKWIPLTDVYLKNVYQKMTHVWLYNYIRHRPKTFAGKVVFVVSNAVEGYAEDGTVYGAVSGVLQKDAPQLIREHYASVPDIFAIPDYAARYYTLMRITIEQYVTLVVMPNPSSVVEMQNSLTENYEQICDDIEHGTLSAAMSIPDDIRKALQPLMKPNPGRAEELRALKRKYGEVLPKHYWPDVQVLSTWKCGNTQIYVDKFTGWFPEQCFYQELGYFATECRFGLVLDDSVNSVLFPHMHYYEFVEESDIGSRHPSFLQLDELVEGKRYCPYVTTFSGLYRYNMNDLVQAGPAFWHTPTVHMVQKVNGIISMTGEKLYEGQFVDAVREAEKKLRLKTRFFVGFADLSAMAYQFYYEFMNRDTSQEMAERFSKKVDEILQRINIEYRAKRESFRLKTPGTHRLEQDAYARFKKQSIKDGTGRDGQFKLNLLMQDEKRRHKFDEIEVKDDEEQKNTQGACEN